MYWYMIGCMIEALYKKFDSYFEIFFFSNTVIHEKGTKLDKYWRNTTFYEYQYLLGVFAHYDGRHR